jgi:hypothetical protein
MQNVAIGTVQGSRKANRTFRKEEEEKRALNRQIYQLLCCLDKPSTKFGYGRVALISLATAISDVTQNGCIHFERKMATGPLPLYSSLNPVLATPNYASVILLHHTNNFVLSKLHTAHVT